MGESCRESKSEMWDEERDMPRPGAHLREDKSCTKRRILGKEVAACSPWSLRRKEVLEAISERHQRQILQ